MPSEVWAHGLHRGAKAGSLLDRFFRFFIGFGDFDANPRWSSSELYCSAPADVRTDSGFYPQPQKAVRYSTRRLHLSAASYGLI